MIDPKALLNGLRRELRRLEADLAEQAESDAGMKSALEAEYGAGREAERIGESFNAWRGGVLTQAAVAWLLGCVFVRFAEDNGLVDDALIAGPGERNMRASDRQTLYFRAHPTDSDRDYLFDVFTTISSFPGMTRLYDRQHNPVWHYPVSGDAARDLLAFWRAVDPDTGMLRHDFTDPDWDTRFLGDLYQDLSDHAKKRFALLQTPEFVEEFILDRTLTPALDEFGLPGTRLIDPACGSGHFLLGAFTRLLRAWFDREPGTPERALVQRALDGVYGVDINPFAAAIARFRLLVTALRTSGIERLNDAPNFQIHVAAGDSLLHGRRFDELDVGSGAEQLANREKFNHAFQDEDIDELNRILGQQYHVVVGNPPYVTVKDTAVNQLYRARYSTCHRRYSLVVPFTERFFSLTLANDDSKRAGYVGMITANSFMKREFGKKLIEFYLPTVDLTHIIDSSGAYIPGHRTPTVIMFGRHRAAVEDVIRTVMGIKGEPSIPKTPSKGCVWLALVGQLDLAKSESAWASSEDIARKVFSVHPWSIGGGGANELMGHLAQCSTSVLGDLVHEIGYGVVTREDEAYLVSREVAQRNEIEPTFVKSMVAGDTIRHWAISEPIGALWPYEEATLEASASSPLLGFLWRYRSRLRERVAYGQTQLERGLAWYEYSMFFKHRHRVSLSIAFAFVATHNHFVLDRGGKVFKQTAPVIKLPSHASEADHLALVGVLNSSAACLWMKHTFHDKGGAGAWERRFEHAGQALLQFPLPRAFPFELSMQVDALADEHQTHLPTHLVSHFPMTPAEIYAHRDTADRLLKRMIALQEELDWECYRLYDITESDYRYLDAEGKPKEPPALSLGERAFEISLARRLAADELDTTWFLITYQAHLEPAGHRKLVFRRPRNQFPDYVRSSSGEPPGPI